ncbi:unnamed protein product [Protopolystoma xenopodis]|uniref:Uncharacterized protein n=1 Tax=Protopolystoma xenopodis TaxID=117903 RepID=A0A3S5BWG1_9PLAT|nr:unnamed protein product [Protopolystoma xenopodis]
MIFLFYHLFYVHILFQSLSFSIVLYQPVSSFVCPIFFLLIRPFSFEDNLTTNQLRPLGCLEYNSLSHLRPDLPRLEHPATWINKRYSSEDRLCSVPKSSSRGLLSSASAGDPVLTTTRGRADGRAESSGAKCTDRYSTKTGRLIPATGVRTTGFRQSKAGLLIIGRRLYLDTHEETK